MIGASMLLALGLSGPTGLWCPAQVPEKLPRFREEVIDRELGCCYGMAIADVNGDGKPDLILATEYPDLIVWYENPTWKRRVIRKGHPAHPEPIVPFDVDGDGKLALALGADWSSTNTTSGGTLWVLRPSADLDQPWTATQIEEEPSLHRLRAIDLEGRGKRELLVSTIQGRGTQPPEWWKGKGALQFILHRPAGPEKSRWEREIVSDTLHFVHGVWPVDWDGNGKESILFAAYEGIFLAKRGPEGKWSQEKIASGDPERGASDVRLGRLPGGKRYLVAIEPNHGPRASIYTPPEHPGELWKRKLLVEGHTGGHVLVLADLTGTGVESVVVGFRGLARPTDFVPGEPGKDYILYAFHPLDPEGDAWEKKVLDDRGMASDSAFAVDLKGRGRLDLVVGGYVTRNLKIYWNEGR
ncbi:MAG TPA: VCBS repeat-containing protein [Planctomycetota bacterium]|nr:VCBS repeat-containing protein [Planctomycetota bacterium]